MNTLKTAIRNNLAGAAIVLYVVVFMSVQYMNPSFLYNEDGSLREFGIGYSSKTILPIWLVAILLGILSYVTVYYISLRLGSLSSQSYLTTEILFFSSASFFFVAAWDSLSTCARIFCCSGVNVQPIFSK